MNLIIVEGPRGVGKTTIVQAIRNTIPQTMVFQLTGLNKTPTEKEDVYNHYLNLHTFLKDEKKFSYNLVLDRSFFTEEIMAKLYKDYTFDEECNELLEDLVDIGINIVVINLFISEEMYNKRLQREGKVEFQNLKYAAKDSIREQEEYKKMFERLKDEFSAHKNLHIQNYYNGGELSKNQIIDEIKQLLQ